MWHSYLQLVLCCSGVPPVSPCTVCPLLSPSSSHSLAGTAQARPQLWIFSSYYWSVEAAAYPPTVWGWYGTGIQAGVFVWADDERTENNLLLTHKRESLMGCDLRKQNPWGSDGISKLNIGMKGYKPFFFDAIFFLHRTETNAQSPLWSQQLKTEETPWNGIRPHGPKLSVQLRIVN